MNKLNVTIPTLLACLFLSSCNGDLFATGGGDGGQVIVVEDGRLTREEVAAAFKQRDKAIEILTEAVKELQGKENGSDEK